MKKYKTKTENKYKIKVGDKWICNNNLLMLTVNEEYAAHLDADQTICLQELLSYSYGKKIKIIKDGN